MTRPSRPVSSSAGAPYFDEAKRRNAAWHEKPSEKAFAGVAKPILVFDEAASYEPRWRLRTQTCERRDPVTVSYVTLPVTEGGVEHSTHNRTGSALALSHHDTQLRIAIAHLIDEYKVWAGAVDQRQVLHLLHRLQIYARGVQLNIRENESPAPGATQQSPTQHTMSRSTFDSYMEFFTDLRERIELAKDAPPTAEEAAQDLQTLKVITRYFRELSLTLPDMIDKLATKPLTYLGEPPRLRARLAQLVERSLQKLTRDTPDQAFRQFICAFTHASRAFCREDRIDQSNDLNALFNKTIPRLRGLQSADKYPIFDLFAHLVDRVLKHNDHSLVPMLEALLLNEEFNLYVERLGTSKVGSLHGALKALLRDVRTPLWQAGAEVLVRRPPDEFCDLVEELVATTDSDPIDDLPLNYIFVRLNEALDALDDTLAGTAQAERYNGFLERLADANGLHALTMAGATLEERQRVMRNLNALYHVDLHDISRLDAFFSNALFRAVNWLAFAGRAPIFGGRRMLRDVAAMLQKAGSNPVEDVGLFEKQLHAIVVDYAQGFSALRGLVLRSLGERLAPGFTPARAGVAARPTPVETWLRDTVMPSYDGLMRIVLRCYPLVWQFENFAFPHAYTNKVIMSQSGSMFVARHEGGRPVLLDILGRNSENIEPEFNQTYYRSGNLRTLLQAGDALAQHDEIQRAMEAMALGYNDFLILNLSDDKMRRMEALQAMMLGRLRLIADTHGGQGISEENLDAFKQRIQVMGKFLSSVSSFAQLHLEAQAEQRFFRGGTLTEYGRDFIKGDERANATELTTLRAAVANRMFDVGYRAVAKILGEETPVASLCEAVGKIERLVEREIDILSFNTDATVKSFNRRHSEDGHGRSVFQIDSERVENLRQSLYRDAEVTLKKRNIDYIMPNQALAAELCRHPHLENKNILLKMGTGQGKSIVIATTALFEAGRLGAGEYVFVLTSYDHLARGDHATGRDFFVERGIESACISDLADIEKLTPDTKIIYADAKTLQLIAQKMIAQQILTLLDQARHPPPPKQLTFLQQLYTGSHRFILDEYDLVLNDLDYTRGCVMNLGPMINKGVVHKHRSYATTLDSAQPVAAQSRTATDQTDGKSASTINAPYIVTSTGQEAYNLRTGGLRISRLLAKAQRIIGLSGSGAANALTDVKGLEHVDAAYFELPSSRDPDAFGTLVVHSKEQLQGVPGIWRTEYQEILNGSESDYIAAIVSDVQNARALRHITGGDGQQTRRPVLIFVDPEQTDRLKRLRAALVQACGDNKVHEKFTEQSLVGHLNEIGIDGNVTLTSLLCGRGADIFVSPNVPDGLHVVVGIPLATTRLQTQVIGRTGRMGRNGSYATITLGRSLIETQNKPDFRHIENRLHDLSRRLVERLAQGCTKDYALKWLLYASETFWYYGRSESVERHKDEFT